MTESEAVVRSNAAAQRLKEADPALLVGYALTILVVDMFWAVIHLCIGFGTVTVLGLSMWWGLPLAWLSMRTLGWARRRIRREAKVLKLERLAEAVEVHLADE